MFKILQNLTTKLKMKLLLSDRNLFPEDLNINVEEIHNKAIRIQNGKRIIHLMLYHDQFVVSPWCEYNGENHIVTELPSYNFQVPATNDKIKEII